MIIYSLNLICSLTKWHSLMGLITAVEETNALVARMAPVG